MADNQRVTEVECPVLKKIIKDIDCIENRDIVDGNLDERFIPEGFKERRDWKGACRACKWHEY